MRITLRVLLATLIPAYGSAQTPVHPGQRVRVHLADGGEVHGSVSAQTVIPGSRVRISAAAAGLDRTVGTVQDTAGGVLLVQVQRERVVQYEGFQRTVSEATLYTIDRASITVLEVYVGTRGRAGQGGVIGLGLGVGLGFLLGEDCGTSDSFVCFDRSTVAVALGGPFGLVGLGIGALSRTDRWEPASRPSSPTASIQVRPTFSNGVGFAASIPFGR